MFDSHGQLVSIRVLGPVEVTVGADQIRLSRLQRHLIAAMAVEPGRVVPVDVLCEALWGEDQPRDGRNRVQALVSSLRRVLGEDTILTRPPGYHLNLELVTCDSGLFERDLPHLGRLERALGLWRGTAFSGVREKALRLVESLYYPLGMKFALSTLGEIMLQAGDYFDARESLRAAAEVARPMSGVALAGVLYRLGQAEAALGNHDTARSLGREALDLYAPMNRPETGDVRAWLDTLPASSSKSQ
ncbi:MAG TPA: winged helix-turn-helix domain-containing protein [Candidatus Limnocylindrales bacterium]|nr:winged helix-turn-helix domain-containing protein [Candidatus Limnocylindrales bacterium]